MAPSTRYPSHSSPSSPFDGGTLAEHYNVFLSFRGPDTRQDFAACLYEELIHGATPHVFRDKEEIHGGEEINPTLIQAIERSDMSIPIISPRYAESKACLMELAHMLLCRKTRGHKVIPIFYLTQPDILKGFPQALEDKLGRSSKLAKIFSNYKRTMKEWKEAFNGWKEALSDLADHREKYHSLTKAVTWTTQNLEPSWERPWPELFSEVVKDVKAHLGRDNIWITDKFVPIDHHEREMMRKLGVDYCVEKATKLLREETHVVTVTGPSGIGKTTLAKVVYNKIQHLFDTCSCLEKIHENLQSSSGLERLQRQLITELNNRRYLKSSHNRMSNDLKSMFKETRVLLLLDDVHDIKEVEELAKESEWFGRGSRIIVTSNVKLKKNGLIEKAREHMVKEMEENSAIDLFSMHAYGQNQLDESNKYDPLAKQIVNVVKRIPSAIVDIGSALRGERINRWNNELHALKKSPHIPFKKSFEASYKLLRENDLHGKNQHIFLDIACFFAGTNKKVSKYMWRSTEFSASPTIKYLGNMFWVKIEENRDLCMPDLLQGFGKEMVEKETECCWERSRLWNHEEAKETLKNNRGNNTKVQGLRLGCEDHGISLENDNFRGLSKLAFLKLGKAVIKGEFTEPLLNLKWLDWQVCIEGLHFLNLEKLVILDLSNSQVDHQWTGWQLIREKAELLKVLKLTGCKILTEFPDLDVKLNLERLILDSCSELKEVDSIKKLKKLKSLSLISCKSVLSLPDLSQMPDLKELLLDDSGITELNLPVRKPMRKLKILSAQGCKLGSLPKSIGKLERLKKLVLDGATEIQELPNSITSLTKLRVLSMSGCTGICSLPDGFGNLSSLEMLDLSETYIGKLPKSIKKLENLKVLKMRRTLLQDFPGQVTNLQKLEVIDLRNCRNLQEIPSDINGLSSLRILRLSYTRISSLPKSIADLAYLKVLELCKTDLKEIPQNLTLDSLRYKVIWCQASNSCDHRFPEF